MSEATGGGSSGAAGRRALFDAVPNLAARVPIALLAELPTPIRRLDGLARAIGSAAELFQKCDDRTSPLYGGNKVRTLEWLLGDALARGATHIDSTGAYGSNHAAATVMHAPRVGLVPGAVLYPQPPSASAAANLTLVLSRAGSRVRDLPHWSALPLGMWSHARGHRRRGERAVVMMPGGATPLGALGYASAGLELAFQVHEGVLPRPATIVVAAGSNCTTAGLLVGCTLATRLGIGFHERGCPKPPRVVAVRVTPWPVTSRWRILRLAEKSSQLLAHLAGNEALAVTHPSMSPMLTIDGSQLGPGYGFGTGAGLEAARLWQEHAGQALELTYSAKSAAAAIARLRSRAEGPILYWATKSSAPLPEVSGETLEHASARMRRWLDRARRCGPES